MLPSASAEPDRYRGRPLMIILENYVLAAIGSLPPKANQQLAEMVKSVFGGGDDWQKTVREQLGLADSLDDALHDMWQRNQMISKQQQIGLDPVQFAKMVVDENFAELIAPPLKR